MKNESFIKTIQTDESIEITIDRPDRRNSLGISVAKALLELTEMAMKKATAGNLRCLVIKAIPCTSSSQKTWIAGGDLKELSQVERGEAARHYANTMSTVCRNLIDIPAVVVAAIDGATIGGGAELVLFADIRIATACSNLEFRQLNVGLPTGYGGAARLRELIGLAHAQKLIWGRKPVSSSEAEALGLFHEIVDTSEDLDKRVQLLKSSIISWPQEVIAAQKALLKPSITDADALEQFVRCWRNPIHQKTLDSFSQKKSPQ